MPARRICHGCGRPQLPQKPRAAPAPSLHAQGKVHPGGSQAPGLCGLWSVRAGLPGGHHAGRRVQRAAPAARTREQSMIAAGVYAPSVGQMPGESHLFLPEMARIARAEPMTALEKLFTLELPRGRSLGHRPGQFVEVSALGVGEAPISISSSPSRSNGTFEVCVRRAGDVTGALHRMKPGDRVGIRGPFGRGFPMEKFRGKDMLFAPGGLGLAPLRSLINQVLDERAYFGRVFILYGARTPSELLFK